MKTPIINIKKYGGKQVALVRGRIVASGYSTKKVLEAAQKKIPEKDHDNIWLLSVPKSLTVVYRI